MARRTRGARCAVGQGPRKKLSFHWRATPTHIRPIVPGGFGRHRPGIEATGHRHTRCLPEDRAVRNSVSIGGEMSVIVVSGGNPICPQETRCCAPWGSIRAGAGRQCGPSRQLAPFDFDKWERQIRVSEYTPGGSLAIIRGDSAPRQILDLTGGAAARTVSDRRVFCTGTNSHDRRTAPSAGKVWCPGARSG